MSDPTVCFHCGLPNNGRRDLTLQRGEDLLYFCCPGCRAVAQTIVDGGLGKFYEYRQVGVGQAPERALIRPAPSPQQTDYGRYDRAEFQRGFVQHEDDQCTALINIEGISCAACTWLIEQRLQRVAGIDQVHVNLAKHRATIRYREGSAALSDIFSAIDDIGYSPSPYSPDHEEQLLEREQRDALKRLGVAGLGMMQVGMFAIALHAGHIQGMAELYRDFLRQVSLIVATAVVFYAAQPFFKAAWRDISNRSLGMNVPVSLAIGLAYGASFWATVNGSGEVYFDSVAMFTFFLLGSRYLEMRARHRNEHISRGLSALQAPYAWRLADVGGSDPTTRDDAPGNALPGNEQPTGEHLTGEHLNGDLAQIPADQLVSGDRVLIKSGELIPADGSVESGHSSVDESVFSGEYLPVAKGPGDMVIAGSVNGDGILTVHVSATQGRTRLDIITRLLERAQANKPRSALLADRLASVFVLLVLTCASVTAVFWLWRQPGEALWIALSVLVVSCPCALSLATPTALTVALATLKNRGVLLSRSDVLEKLPTITTVVFDKTGTLTTGKLTLSDTRMLGSLSDQRCQLIASALERHSSHPIASAFPSPSGHLEAVDAIDIVVGHGISGIVQGERYFIGSLGWVASKVSEQATSTAVQQQLAQVAALAQHSNARPSTPAVHIALACEREWLALFELDDTLRPGAVSALSMLRQRGLSLRMLSGDSSVAVAMVADALTIEEFQGGLSPQQKLSQIERWQAQGERVLMVGDGINDVPVLAAADISVAVVDATALAKASADCLLLSGDVGSINVLLDTAERTRRVIKQNLGWALLYNLGAIPLAASGHIPPWLAALGMSTSSLVVVANALRLSNRAARRDATAKHRAQANPLPPLGA